INVGSHPGSVAINPVTNQAVVTNRSDGSVSLVDLNTFTVIATIPVGGFPRGVAIHAQRNLAVVANANTNDVRVIDLQKRAVVAIIGVGPAPTGVAINTSTNTVVITNSGVVKGNLNSGVPNSLSSVSILNLDSGEVEATIPTEAA